MNPGAAASYGALFTATVRPARAVYLITEASEEGFRRAVREACTRWAGACEVIVEVRSDGSISDEHRRVVELAGPEGAVNVDASVEAATTAAESLGLELVSSIEHIDQLGWTAYSCTPSDLGLPSTVDGTNGHVIASAGGSLWEATAAGDLSHEAEQALRWESLVVRRPRSPDEIGRAQLWQHTLLDRTVAYFGENTATRIANGPTVLWLTGDDGECQRTRQTPRWRSVGLPAGGHEISPVTDS